MIFKLFLFNFLTWCYPPFSTIYCVERSFLLSKNTNFPFINFILFRIFMQSQYIHEYNKKEKRKKSNPPFFHFTLPYFLPFSPIFAKVVKAIFSIWQHINKYTFIIHLNLISLSPSSVPFTHKKKIHFMSLATSHLSELFFGVCSGYINIWKHIKANK